MPQLSLEEQIEKKKAEIRQLENRLRKKNGRLSAETRQKRNKFITVVGYGVTKLLSKNPTLKNDVLSVLDKKDRDFFTANYSLLVDDCPLCGNREPNAETIEAIKAGVTGKTYGTFNEWKNSVKERVNA